MTFTARTALPRLRLTPWPLHLLAFAVVIFSLSGSAAQALAQSPSPTPVEDVADVVRVDTTLVNVPVTVMNRQGRVLPNLRLEDFYFFEGGRGERIAHFSARGKPLGGALL